MSCLTKKSLFLLVLTIVCNPTFSDRTSDCIRSIHEVFKEDVPPTYHFKLAMYSISEELISSKNGTQEYIRYYEENAEVLSRFSTDELYTTRHNETLNYFRSIIQRPVSPINLPPESKKEFVLGYFNSLIDHFDNPNTLMIARPLINKLLQTPLIFCSEISMDITGLACVEALYTMLRDPQQPDNIPANMNGYQILKYLYTKFTHLDFTVEKYYSQIVIDDEDDITYYKLQILTMAGYFGYIADRIQGLVDKIHLTGFQFPTIQGYCSSGSST